MQPKSIIELSWFIKLLHLERKGHILGSSISISGNLNKIWQKPCRSHCYKELAAIVLFLWWQGRLRLRCRHWLEIDLLFILFKYQNTREKINICFYKQLLLYYIYFVWFFNLILLDFWVLNNRTCSSVENFKSDGMTWLHVFRFNDFKIKMNYFIWSKKLIRCFL